MSVATAVPPISSANRSIRSVRRATATTWKPRAASVLAVASPIPELAPVTTATREWASRIALIGANSNAVLD
jgi:hypothetical protein